MRASCKRREEGKEESRKGRNCVQNCEEMLQIQLRRDIGQ